MTVVFFARAVLSPFCPRTDKLTRQGVLGRLKYHVVRYGHAADARMKTIKIRPRVKCVALLESILKGMRQK